MRRVALLRSLLVALAFLAGVGPAAAATVSDDVALAERLARTRFHEGVPAEEARQIGDAGAARLAEMLRDQSEARHHAQIAEVLGMSGHPSAWATLQREVADVPRGEVDRAIFRKRVALRAALGHLARHDERALDALLAEADASPGPPRWSCGRHRGTQLADTLRRSSLNALALSGQPRARRALRRLRDADHDAARKGELDAALAELDRVERRRAEQGAEEPQGSQR